MSLSNTLKKGFTCLCRRKADSGNTKDDGMMGGVKEGKKEVGSNPEILGTNTVYNIIQLVLQDQMSYSVATCAVTALCVCVCVY